MKKIVTSIALILAGSFSYAQTTATDWTATDCNGLSHTLFTELDSGKVIVFAWVMPCGSCVNPAKTAYNTVQSFATSHPGKVRFYLADDLGDASCTTLSNWVTTNSVGSVANMKIFSNSGNVIDENDFGGTGMPHIVVMGGPSHQIFFNKKNSASNDASGINSAITSAIGATTGVATLNKEISFTVSPNPTTGSLTIQYDKAVTHVTITDITGQLILDQDHPKGKMNPGIDASRYSNGLYIVKITDTEGNTGIRKVVKQ